MVSVRKLRSTDPLLGKAPFGPFKSSTKNVAEDRAAQWRAFLPPSRNTAPFQRTRSRPKPIADQGPKPPDDLEPSRARFAEAIGALVQSLGSVPKSELHRAVAERLGELLSLGVIDPEAINPTEETYAKALIYNHPDPEHPFSVWAFAFGPGQKTPVHDHRCECSSTVLEGSIVEKRYSALPRTEPGKLRATVVESKERGPLDTAHLDPELPNIHRIENVSDKKAVTVHLYQLDAEVMPNSSIKSGYRGDDDSVGL